MLLFFTNNQIDNDLIARVQSGEVFILPTETIYGIGCSALKDASIRRVFKIKGRASHQPPPVLIGDVQQLSLLVSHIPLAAQGLMDKHWPGALTIILPARAEVSPLLCSLNEDKNTHESTRAIGVRLTGHAFIRELCQRTAPLVATSANFTGATGDAATPRQLEDIPEAFKRQADFLIDGGVVGDKPSTVVDCTGTTPRVLRMGAIPLKL